MIKGFLSYPKYHFPSNDINCCMKNVGTRYWVVNPASVTCRECLDRKRENDLTKKDI